MSSMLARHREMLEDLFEMRGGFFLISIIVHSRDI